MTKTLDACQAWPGASVELVPTSLLLPYARNARTHSPEQIAIIADLMLSHGFTNPVLRDEENGIIAGHGRVMAAGLNVGRGHKQFERAPCITARGWTEEQKRGYVLADNQTALRAGWDMALLGDELTSLSGAGVDLASLGFGKVELAELMNQTGGVDAIRADDIPATPRVPVIQPGDMFSLGDHRILCGDSTDGALIARLMGAERAELVFTSPPYKSQRDYASVGVVEWDVMMRGVFAHAPRFMTDGGQMLVNLGMIHRDNEWLPYWDGWVAWMREQGMRRFGLYVWDQGPGLPGDWAGRMAPSFELVFHFNRRARKPNKIVPCKFVGEVTSSSTGLRKKDGSISGFSSAGRATQPFRIPDGVLRIMRHKARGGIEMEHPAVFPVALPGFVMRAYSDPGDIVYDPFLGSGTTIIAAEMEGRACFGLEISPAYCDVIVKRWEDFTGKRAERLNGPVGT